MIRHPAEFGILQSSSQSWLKHNSTDASKLEYDHTRSV
jgi:hypothetical protein